MYIYIYIYVYTGPPQLQRLSKLCALTQEIISSRFPGCLVRHQWRSLKFVFIMN